MARSTVILDACVAINLFASGEFDAIISSKNRDFAICSKVQEESMFLRPEDPAIAALERISLDEVIDSDKLGILVVENEEEEALYVNYAAKLDDGEAMSLALAESRGFHLATDDRKARRLFDDVVGESERLLSTSELIREWAESSKISRSRLRLALYRIMSRAKFAPNRNDSNFEWWNAAIS